VSGHQRDGLGDVEGRAAAQSDHGVGTVVLVGRHALAHLAAHGIAPDAGEDAGMKRGQRRHEFREQGQWRDPAVGDDERSPDVLRPEVIRDERTRARRQSEWWSES
jgi:hypothetical protein